MTQGDSDDGLALMRSGRRALLVSAVAFTVGACSGQASSGPGAAGAGGTTGDGGNPVGGQAGGGAGAGGGGATGGEDGGRPVRLVTFAFTGHITALVSVDVTSDGYVPAVGDPFTGSYTFNAVALSSVTGEFFEGAPAAVAADLEVDTLAAAYPPASAPDGQEPSFTIVSTPTTYSLAITPYAVTPELNGGVAGMFFSWNLSNPNGMGAQATELSAVPPDLSVWTQGSDAVSIQLFDYSGITYRVTGVIDTIQTR
jgi:hypothetical protein